MSRRALALALALGVAEAGAAQAQTHPGGRWWTLETDHFRVHVRPEQRALGALAAAEAEAAYAALAQHVPPPRGRIDLVLTDHADFSNGFATTYPTPRVVVHALPPVGDLELAAYDRWLRLVLTHELTHVFQLETTLGWWKLARRVLGRAPGFFPNEYVPAWLSEGIAVAYESRLTDAGRLRGSFHGSIVTSAIAEGGGVPIDAAGGLSPRWPAGLRPYALGGSFVGWLALQGDSVVPRLVREIARRPVPYLGLSGALQPAAGMSLGRAWLEWQVSLRGGRTDAPTHRRTEAAGTGAQTHGGTVLLSGLRDATPPRVSADGRRVLFIDDDGRREVRVAVLDRSTGAVRRLSRVNGPAAAAWAGGDSIVVAQLEFTDPYTLRSDLWTVSAGGRERRLTSGARLVQPDVARDGAIFAARAFPGGTELVRVTSDGIASLTHREPGVEWAHPRVSPDGRTIAATRAAYGRHDVALVPVGGGHAREVTADAAIDRTPAFSPDGRWLLWSSDRTGTSQIYAMDLAAAEGTPWQVTAAPYGAFGPAVAADSVFYFAYHHDGFRLEAVPLDTAAWRRAPSAASGVSPGPNRAPDAAILAEHAYRPTPSLWPHYWFPLAEGSSVGSVAWLGAFTSSQDALERHTYVADVLLGLGDAAGRWRGQLFYAYAGFTPATMDVWMARDELQYVVASGTVAPGSSAAAAYRCCVTDDEASFGVTVPRRRYRTRLAVRLGAEYQRFGVTERAGAVLSFAAARVTQPALAVSPQDGWQFSGALRQRWRVDRPVGYTQGIVRGALYRSREEGAFARHVVAVRAAVGGLSGTDPVVFLVGGVSGGTAPILPGLSVGGGQRTFPVRGYAPGAAYGRGVAQGTLEYRVPIALVGRGVGFVPWLLDRVSLAVFADGAYAWSPAGGILEKGRITDSASLGSVGGELVVDMGLMNDYPLRLRFGVAQPLTRGHATAGYAAVGSAF